MRRRLCHLRCDTGSQRGKIEDAPIDQRQVVDEFAVDDLAGDGVLGLQLHGGSVYFDSFRGSANGQGNIHGNILADIHADLAFLLRLETLGHHGQRIGAGRDGAKSVPAVLVGNARKGVSLLLVDQSDIGRGYHPPEASVTTPVTVPV